MENQIILKGKNKAVLISKEKDEAMKAWWNQYVKDNSDKNLIKVGKHYISQEKNEAMKAWLKQKKFEQRKLWENACIEKERLEKEKIEQEKINKERLRLEKEEREKINQERIRLEQEERERINKERIRLEQEERERINKERIRLEQEKRERIRLEQEKRERINKERIRLEQEERERERKRLEQEERERKRLEQEEIERKRLEEEKKPKFVRVGRWIITQERHEQMLELYNEIKKKKEKEKLIKIGNFYITQEKHEQMLEFFKEKKLIKVGNNYITQERHEQMKLWYQETLEKSKQDNKVKIGNVEITESKNIEMANWWNAVIDEDKVNLDSIDSFIDSNSEDFKEDCNEYINNNIVSDILREAISLSLTSIALDNSSKGLQYLKNNNLTGNFSSVQEMSMISTALENNCLEKQNKVFSLLKDNGYYLFHKYLLGLESVSDNINYDLIHNNISEDFKNNKYYAHLHCYDISRFHEIYGEYIDKISEYFSIIITYSIGDNSIQNERFVVLKIPNKGMDIGGKFCAVKYLNDNNITYEYILFLHSKSNPKTRKKYFEPLINNLDDEFIQNINYYDGYFPDIQWEIVGDKINLVSNNPDFKNYENKNLPERNEFLKYCKATNNTNQFIEGNCFILSKKVIDKLYTDPLLYKILNTDSSFDYNWVINAYDIKGNIYKVYKQFTDKNLLPRNQTSFDGYFEHVFERVVLNFCDNYKIFDNKLITKITNKDDFRKLCNFNLSLINNIIIPDIELDKPNETFYIEFRKFRHCEFIIRNVIIKLPDWSHTIICGNLNYEFMKKMANLISPNIKIVKLDINNLNTAEYSRLLMSKEFWNNFNGEKLLLYQEDSYMFHNRIDEFLEYDYIGAPWPIDQDEHINQKEYGVGNGGFSLRSKSKMIEVIEKINWKKDLTLGSKLKEYMKNTNNYIIPEDVYFSKSLLEKNIGKVAPRNIALNFSQETQKSPNPLGGHNFYLADNYTLPNYNRLYLNNDQYYKSVTHRGGWKSIIQYGLNNNTICNKYNYLQKIILEDCCESYFLGWSGSQSLPITNKWIGITHFTNNVPSIWNNCHIDNLLNNKIFIKSLDNCNGLIVLSNFMKKYLSTYNCLKNIPIYSLKHPIGKFVKVFDLDKFLSLGKFNLVLLGQQLRNLSDVFKINSSIIDKKIWLSGISDKTINKQQLYKDLFYNKIVSKFENFDNIKKTLQTPYLSNFEEYDNMMTSSIILIPLYNACANNSVLEIIQSNTPAFITRLPATEEYLGKNYPMFYNDIIEVNNILNNRELFNKKYTETYNYLKDMDKSHLTYERFYSDLLKIINNVYYI
jgi:hypothetical protein